MSSQWTFGVGGTILCALVVVIYLRGHLKKLLIELCGTEERANFWAAFSHVTLVLTPIIFAQHMRPATLGPGLAALSAQIEAAMTGLLIALLLLGYVVGRYIPRLTPTARPATTPVSPR